LNTGRLNTGRLNTGGPARGRLIVLEGGEGCGKSTQAARLAGTLDAVLTREPGGTATGERLRGMLLDPDLPAVEERTETLLMIAPALAAGRAVVCDRFSGSTLAYQGYGRGLGLGDLATMSDWASAGIRPDRVVLLTLPEVESATRLGRRGTNDRMEGQGREFFDRVADGFTALAAADPVTWRVVDGSGPVDRVAARVLAAAQP
jgi:dTMP kinase